MEGCRIYVEGWGHVTTVRKVIRGEDSPVEREMEYSEW